MKIIYKKQKIIGHISNLVFQSHKTHKEMELGSSKIPYR
jgi:hypothetical protein